MADTNEQSIRLKVVTPDGVAMDTRCQCAQLPASDGSMGVKRGHLPALILLGQGTVSAIGHRPEQLEITGGFASVADDVVTVLADGIKSEL